MVNLLLCSHTVRPHAGFRPSVGKKHCTFNLCALDVCWYFDLTLFPVVRWLMNTQRQMSAEAWRQLQTKAFSSCTVPLIVCSLRLVKLRGCGPEAAQHMSDVTGASRPFLHWYTEYRVRQHHPRAELESCHFSCEHT